ncbi:MAG: hypothetical protein NVSMB18_02830 [Acetobacteraceae bacterium]
MTQRTWNGATDSYFTAADWSPSGVPQPGDTVVINSGVATIDTAALTNVLIKLNGSSSAVGGMRFTNSLSSARIDANSTARLLEAPVTIAMIGTNYNEGIVSFTGSSGSRFSTTIDGTSNASAGSLINDGSLDAVAASPSWSSSLVGPVGTLQNEGMISVWNPSSTVLSALINVNLSGGGVVQVDPGAAVSVGQGVAATQTVDFTGGTGANSLLEIVSPAAFAGTINGFAQGDTIRLQNTPFDAYHYANLTANSGVLQLFSQGNQKAALALTGNYQTSSFSATGLGSGSGSVSFTTTAQPAQPFSFTNSILGLSSTDAGVAYTGPVAGISQQYLWSGPDSVAISASVPNVFIKGGAGGDALAVSSGTNVLDGGKGSNFLVGSSDLNSRDTFFVDGRGSGESWGTIVNFHFGDQATIFGFHPGTSTMPFTASDGAAGYQGATIHSELNGSGTGVTASMTFTGIDVATANAHFTFTSGTLPGNIDYLLIQYNR